MKAEPRLRLKLNCPCKYSVYFSYMKAEPRLRLKLVRFDSGHELEGLHEGGT